MKSTRSLLALHAPCLLLGLWSCGSNFGAPSSPPTPSASGAVDEPDARAEAPPAIPGSDEPAAPPRGLPKSALRMEPAVILDPTGFEEPMVASTLFLPLGWNAVGGVSWGAQYMCTNGYVFDWSATSPDGAASVAVLPQERWEWNNYGAPASSPGCTIAAITNVRSYLEDRVRRTYEAVRLTGFRAREDLRRQFSAFETTTPMPMGESRTWIEAGEVSFTHRADGRERLGTLAAIIAFSQLYTDPGAGMAAMEGGGGSTWPLYATSALSSAHDPALFEAIRASIRVDPRWERRIAGHHRTIARIGHEESRKRQAMLARHNEEMAQIRKEAWDSYQESSDRRAREFGEMLRDVETYSDEDAPGGQVELSHFYENAWRLDDGTYVLTNDASFDPWRDLQVAGRKLEAAE